MQRTVKPSFFLWGSLSLSPTQILIKVCFSEELDTEGNASIALAKRGQPVHTFEDTGRKPSSGGRCQPNDRHVVSSTSKQQMVHYNEGDKENRER